MSLDAGQLLELYGITGNALSMIRSYLSGRNKKCQLGDKMSTAKRIECGIPQGLFWARSFSLHILIFLSALNHATARLFADDTNLTVAGISIQEIESSMNRVAFGKQTES